LCSFNEEERIVRGKRDRIIGKSPAGGVKGERGIKRGDAEDAESGAEKNQNAN
jgi:hypothetical protein